MQQHSLRQLEFELDQLQQWQQAQQVQQHSLRQLEFELDQLQQLKQMQQMQLAAAAGACMLYVVGARAGIGA